MSMEWPIKPPDCSWAAMTAEAVLDRWRERIEVVAAEESRVLSALPYVRGIAVIGSTGRTGRSGPWPLSDVDMLAVADFWEGQDPEELIRQHERRRNAQLAEQGIPNEIEASEWVLLPQDICEAVAEPDDAFFSRIRHPHWLGIVIKAEGGRVFHDFDGQVEAFLDRCKETLSTDRFIKIWLDKVITYCGELLTRAESLIRNGDYMEASLEILRTTYQKLPAGAYAVWRRVPQSSARSVTRFLSAAQEAEEKGAAELYLAASRLDEPTTWDRFAAVPAEDRATRNLMWTIRRGAGEDVDEISATRDILNLSLWKTVITDSSAGPRPRWTGATGDGSEVKAQFEAARGLLNWLRSQVDGPTSSSSRRRRLRG